MLDEKPSLKSIGAADWLPGTVSTICVSEKMNVESKCCNSFNTDSDLFSSSQILTDTMKKERHSAKDLKASKIEDFEILKLLGKGAYGKVYQVRKVHGPNSGLIFAMKAIDKASIVTSKTDVRHTKSERDVLVEVDHPFIVHLHYAFETQKRLYLVQEFCNGGELFRRMEVERMMTEDVARFYLSEIVCALEYLHEQDIVYRDLKTENVMLDSTGHVRIIDFGLSKMNMSEGVTTNTFCGTVEYMAPEVVSKGAGYSKPSDWWSFGVFTYDLLTGRSPFYSNRGKAETKQRILHGKLTLPVYTTPDAQDLIRKLLRRPVSRRLGSHEGAIEIKSHPFFKGVNWSDVYKKNVQPPFVPTVKGLEDVSNFDLRFTSKLISRESDERAEPAVEAACKKDDAVTAEPGLDEEQLLFQDFDYISPEMLTGHLEDKIMNLQELRIRGYGSP